MNLVNLPIRQGAWAAGAVLLLGLSPTLPRSPGLAGQALTLAEAADSALATHPAAAAARAHVDGADAGARAARSRRMPSVGLEANLTRFEEPMVVAPFHSLDFSDPPTFDRTLVQGRLGLSYTVFDGGARGAHIRAASASVGAARADMASTRMELLEGVTAAYLGVLATRAVLDAAQRQVRALQAERDRAQRHFEEGTAPRVAILRAEAALQDARAEVAGTTARVDLAERNLARLTGLPLDAVRERTLTDVTLGPSGVESARATDPRVLRARRVVDAAGARVAAERAGWLPGLDATGGLLDFGTLDGGHVTEWQAGLKLSWPVFTGGARGAAVRRAEAEHTAAREALRLAEMESARATDEARSALLASTARAEALEASVAQWTEVARIEVLSLEEGAGVQRDYLRAEAGLFRARAAHARARYDAVQARVALARAGGFLDRNWMDEALEIRR